MEELKNAGVEKTVMLSGDARSVAEKVASQVGLTDFRAELLPADKRSEIEKQLLASPAPAAAKK